jgi:hypothetical protein
MYRDNVVTSSEQATRSRGKFNPYKYGNGTGCRSRLDGASGRAEVQSRYALYFQALNQKDRGRQWGKMPVRFA